MLVLIYRYIFGYVTLCVKAEHPEKILNICAAKGIGVWRVYRRGERLYFKTSIPAFRKLRFYKRGVSGKIHITKKVGFPFFIARNRYRYGMVLGMILFFFMLHFLSGFVWNICVSGNNTVPSERIVKALDKIGIHEGTAVSKIDAEEKRNELILEESSLSWASINLEGSKLTVNVVETKRNEEKENAPSNLKASEAGVIRRLEVIRGVTVVEVGEPVEKGQLLVSGIVEYEDNTANFVRSVGSVYAEVDKKITVKQPLVITEYLRTGQTEVRRVLSFFGLKIPLFLDRVSKPYESEKKDRAISKGESYLPVWLEERTFFKTQKTNYQISEEIAKERAKKKLEEMLKKEVGDGELISRNENCYVEKGILIINCHIVCVKNIGFEEKMQLDTRN